MDPWWKLGSFNFSIVYVFASISNNGGIIVVIDHFSNYATFILALTNYKVEENAHLFFKNMKL